MHAQNSENIQSPSARLLPFLPVVIAVIAVVYMFDQHSRTLQTVTERSVLTSIARALGMPENASRSEVYARLDAAVHEHDVARRTWVGEHVGLGLNWDAIFQRIERMNPAERAEALRLITTEYHLPANTSIRGIKKNVAHRDPLEEAPVRSVSKPSPSRMWQYTD